MLYSVGKILRLPGLATDFDRLKDGFAEVEVFATAGAEGVKTQSTEDIPGRHAAVVLVTGEAVVGSGKYLAAHSVNKVAGFFGFAQFGIDVRIWKEG